MSLFSIAKKLTGIYANTPMQFALSTVYDALVELYDETDWSFQKKFSGWLCPGNLFNNVGTFTVTPFSNQVVADATATAALRAYSGLPLLTQLQYRDPSYSIYSIVAYDYNTINPGFVTLTLDRPWMEPTSGPGQPYMIYQVYFVAPVQDFRKFIEVRDVTNDGSLDFWSMTQAELANRDPQRSDFSIPSYVVPAGVDQRAGSATLGWQMFELWPHQLSYVPYGFSYRRRGPLPQVPADYKTMSVPYPFTEDMVQWKAGELLCQYKEAQKDRATPRGQGANWILLSQMAEKQYLKRYSEVLSVDVNLDGESLTYTDRRRLTQAAFATMNGAVNLGSYPER